MLRWGVRVQSVIGEECDGFIALYPERDGCAFDVNMVRDGTGPG